MNKQTRFVINKIKETACRSILNIGYRHDSDTTIQKMCEESGIEWHVLEVWPENCEFLRRNNICDNIYNDDVKNIKSLNRQFDAVIWLHGPEHISFQDFLLIRKDIENSARKLVIYQAPEGYFHQGELYNNPYERHVETLFERMFSDLHYQTNNFCDFGEPTFSAWIEK